MRLARALFGLGSMYSAGAMVILAGNPSMRAGQLLLLGGGIVLTLINLFLLMMCADAWHFMCEYYDHLVPYKDT